MPDPQSNDAITRRILSDPRVQRAMQRMRAGGSNYGGPRGTPEAAFARALEQEGLDINRFASTFGIPEGYWFNPQAGQVVRATPDIISWLPTIGVAGLMGGLALAGVGAGGGASTVPEIAGISPELAATQIPGYSAAGLPLASQGMSATSMAALPGASAAPSMSDLAGGGGGGESWLRNLLPDDPSDYLKLGAGLLPLLGRAFSGGGGDGSGPGTSPELAELLNISMNRVKAQEPLFQNINRQMQAGLPSESLLPAPGGRGINTEAETAMNPQQLTALLRTMGGG